MTDLRQAQVAGRGSALVEDALQAVLILIDSIPIQLHSSLETGLNNNFGL